MTVLKCLYLLWVISWFKMALKRIAEMLSGFPNNFRKPVLCLSVKIHVLDKVFPGMYCNAIGCEFNVNATTTYVKCVLKQKNL